MKVVVIIPTYNEHDNIIPLMTALQQQVDKIKPAHEMHILIVDDNSPDGTSAVVQQLMSSQVNVHLLTGEKAGLGVAYTRGIRHAIEILHADAMFGMDADFSHDPNDIPRLLQALIDGADFVIGSRYVKGGTIPKEWGPLRKLNSFFGNIVARYVAGIYRVHDCTSGFRAIRATILRQVDFEALDVKGYAFLVALLHQAVTMGAVVKEVPIHFIDRKYGDSKLGLSDIIEFILNAWWIRMRNLETLLKFSVVGISGVFVNLGIFSLLLHLNINKFIASPVAIEFSIISNFIFNNFWTFKHRKTKDRIRIKGLKFNLVSILSLIVSYGTFIMLGLLFPQSSPVLNQFIGIGPAMIVNYFCNTYWTFREQP
jgi:dolichol-phosphate mannosyltransferase